MSAATFNPDGHILIATNKPYAALATNELDTGDRTVQLWDATNPHTPTHTATIPFSVPKDQNVTAMTFSLDGHALITTTNKPGTSGSGRTVQLWDLTNPHTPTTTIPIPNDLYAIAAGFNPDGHAVIITTTKNPYTTASGGTVQLWDATSSYAPSATIPIPDNQNVTAAAFSADRHTLAIIVTNGNGGTVQLWDVTSSPTHTATITIPDKQHVTAITFSVNGHTLATIDSEGKVQLWDVEWITSLSGKIHSRSCRAAGGGLTVDDWSHLVPDLPYRPTC